MTEHSESDIHVGPLEPWSMGGVDVTRSAEQRTDPLSGWAKVGLAGVFVALIAPASGLVGLWAIALLGQLLAEGLEVSRATLPSVPLDADWDLRLVYVTALALLGLRALVSRLPSPTSRVARLGPWQWWFLAGGGLWAATAGALTLEQHVVHISDGVDLVILGATTLWTASTAMWLIASAGHAAVLGLAVASRRSKAVGGAIAITGIASMAAATPVLADPELIASDDVYRDAPLAGAALGELHKAQDELRGAMHGGGATLALSPAGGGSVRDLRYSTAECMEELATKPAGNERSPVREVAHNISGRFSNRDDALEIVHSKLLDICADEPRRNGKPLIRLLQRASSLSAIDYYRATQRVVSRPSCIFDRDASPDVSIEETLHRKRTFELAMKRLPPSDQELIRERYFEGRSYAEMAGLEAKADTVNRRTTRARIQLLKNARAYCH